LPSHRASFCSPNFSNEIIGRDNKRRELLRQPNIDDWNWEFLRRNQRYKRAYKAVQWLKARLDRKAFTARVSFTAFGMQFRFRRIDRGNGWEWRYQPNGKQPIYFLNDLSSPDNPSSRRYKGKLIKKLKAVTRIDGLVVEDGNGWTPALLQEHEIAVQIDTRFTKKEIISSGDNFSPISKLGNRWTCTGFGTG
jgi:hypothetical protein